MTARPVTPAAADGVAPPPATGPPARAAGQRSFEEVLAGRLRERRDPASSSQPAARVASGGPVTFSGHAQQRLARRGIELTEDQLVRLADGIDAAAGKGSRSSLVLVDDVAFVVGVPARTVVTTLDRSSMRDHVFTNIDSAVLR